MRRFSALLSAMLVAAASAAPAQPVNPIGMWRCVVNSAPVSIDVQYQVNPDQSLFGRGTIIYNGTSAIYQVQGSGNWVALPPDHTSNQWLFHFRLMPSNHPVFSVYARPTGNPAALYNLFRNPSDGSVTETACQRID